MSSSLVSCHVFTVGPQNGFVLRYSGDLVMKLGSAFIVSCLSVSYCIMLVSTQLDVTFSTDVVRKDRKSRDLPLTVA